MYSVVFICTGNLCRSPMAEGILKSKVTALQRTDFRVSSMGIHAPVSEKATSDAVIVCRENNVDISNHLSRPLAFDELRTADLILAMEGFQLDFIRTFVPQTSEKLALLAGWPSNGDKERIVPDPIGGRLGEFRKTYKLIDAHIDRILPFLLAEAVPAELSASGA